LKEIYALTFCKEHMSIYIDLKKGSPYLMIMNLLEIPENATRGYILSSEFVEGGKQQ